MKKLAIIALAATVMTGAAFATDIVVPFWADGGNFSTFIGIKNTTASAIECTVAYEDNTGAAAGGGTFSLPAKAGWSFLPNQTSAGNEGPATAVPNSSATAGSATITHGGVATDISSRVNTIANGQHSAYLTPIN
jgi:hypothetical protein